MTHEDLDFWVIVLAGVGQTIFVVMWGILPWWREWIGRALMTKAFALMLLINVNIVFEFVTWRFEEEIESAIYWLITVGIWLQIYALRRETRRADTGNREVSGTNHPQPDQPDEIHDEQLR